MCMTCGFENDCPLCTHRRTDRSDRVNKASMKCLLVNGNGIQLLQSDAGPTHLPSGFTHSKGDNGWQTRSQGGPRAHSCLFVPRIAILYPIFLATFASTLFSSRGKTQKLILAQDLQSSTRDSRCRMSISYKGSCLPSRFGSVCFHLFRQNKDGYNLALGRFELSHGITNIWSKAHYYHTCPGPRTLISLCVFRPRI